MSYERRKSENLLLIIIFAIISLFILLSFFSFRALNEKRSIEWLLWNYLQTDIGVALLVSGLIPAFLVALERKYQLLIHRRNSRAEKREKEIEFYNIRLSDSITEFEELISELCGITTSYCCSIDQNQTEKCETDKKYRANVANLPIKGNLTINRLKKTILHDDEDANQVEEIVVFFLNQILRPLSDTIAFKIRNPKKEKEFNALYDKVLIIQNTVISLYLHSIVSMLKMHSRIRILQKQINLLDLTKEEHEYYQTEIEENRTHLEYRYRYFYQLRKDIYKIEEDCDLWEAEKKDQNLLSLNDFYRTTEYKSSTLADSHRLWTEWRSDVKYQIVSTNYNVGRIDKIADYYVAKSLSKKIRERLKTQQLT